MDDALRALAQKALEFVPKGARIGLGTGHTTEAFLELLGERARGGFAVKGVPSSEGTALKARQLGIPLTTLDDETPLAVTIDGADEVEPRSLNMIKGRGGALVRERIIAVAARRQIIIVTAEKIVDHLGSRTKLPVEVIPFATPYCRRQIEGLADFKDMRTELRGGAKSPYVTDNGNWIFDCTIPRVTDPRALEQALLSIPGVVDTGLFLGTASLVLVAEGTSIRELTREE
jgi:ribose 5-phosphate isomerase A